MGGAPEETEASSTVRFDPTKPETKALGRLESRTKLDLCMSLHEGVEQGWALRIFRYPCLILNSMCCVRLVWSFVPSCHVLTSNSNRHSPQRKTCLSSSTT